MAILKNKDIVKLNEKEIQEKIKELKMELVKEKITATKGGKLKTREIKRTIARLLTFGRINKKSAENFEKPQNPQRSTLKNSKSSAKK